MSNRIYWSNEAFTDPAKHNPLDFRYIVHAVPDRPNMGYFPEERLEKANFLIRNPDKISSFVISASLIDSTHATTYAQSGFILKVPPENIHAARCTDMFLGNVAMTSLSAKKVLDDKYARFGLPSPRTLLELTRPDDYNEIAVAGTSESGKVEIVGIFIKVGPDGKPVRLKDGRTAVTPERLEALTRIAAERNLRIIKIPATPMDYR